jgi:PPM family protein phosphatase
MWKFWKSTEPDTGWSERIDSSLLSDVGCVREANEDSGMLHRPVDKRVLSERGLLAIVADGVGGHSAGEVASRLAVDTVVREYYRRKSAPCDALRDAFVAANRAIFRKAASDQALRGMGTTGVALVIRDSEAWCASVGDSRLYLVREGSTYLMTEDDSVVMDMVRRGLLALEEARHHPDKNVIVRALGTRPITELSVWREPYPIRDEDRFVLCSDGLYDLVEDVEIGGFATRSDPQTACRELVELAKSRGGHDNITVAVLAIRAAEAQTARALRETRGAEVIV